MTEFVNIISSKKLNKKGGGIRNNFNLLDKIKLMEFNPYSFNLFSSNPYRDLSDRDDNLQKLLPYVF